jgi:hypothetical protein
MVREGGTGAGLAALAVLCLSAPASATVLYTNGPVNGTVDAWNISTYTVADSFTLASPATLTSVDFGVWQFPEDTTLSVDWEILSGGPPGTGTTLDSDTASVSQVFLYTNSWGYDIYTTTFSLPSIPLAGGDYWLALTNAATGSGADVFWDENDGPSAAWQSGAYLTAADGYCTEGGETGYCSEAFTINGEPASVPEPATTSLLLVGAAGLLLRRRFAGRSPRT